MNLVLFLRPRLPRIALSLPPPALRVSTVGGGCPDACLNKVPAPAAPQVYMFLVKWQDLSEKVVYRRFTEIYEFHVSALCVWGGGKGRHHAAPALPSRTETRKPPPLPAHT